MIPEEKKLPEEWEKIDKITVVDPDGWDRKNFHESWNTPIDYDEWQQRSNASTIWMSPSGDSEKITFKQWEPPTSIQIQGRNGENLLTINTEDGTVSGEVEVASEAGRLFVESISNTLSELEETKRKLAAVEELISKTKPIQGFDGLFSGSISTTELRKALDK